MNTRVAILISGGGSNMVALIKSMHEKGYAQPVVVLSNRPDVGGLKKAAEMGVPTEVVDHTAYATRADFERALDAGLRAYAPDLLCLAGFMRILQPAFVHSWQDRILNIHPSLLPKYPGLDTHNRAIAARDAEAGCSVHIVTSDLDMGPVLGQARVPVLSGDTSDSLAGRVLKQEHRLYPEVLRRFVLGEETPVSI